MPTYRDVNSSYESALRAEADYRLYRDQAAKHEERLARFLNTYDEVLWPSHFSAVICRSAILGHIGFAVYTAVVSQPLFAVLTPGMTGWYGLVIPAFCVFGLSLTASSAIHQVKWPEASTVSTAPARVPYLRLLVATFSVAIYISFLLFLILSTDQVVGTESGPDYLISLVIVFGIAELIVGLKAVRGHAMVFTRLWGKLLRRKGNRLNRRREHALTEARRYRAYREQQLFLLEREDERHRSAFRDQDDTLA
ncbi:MAG: hypothetical protein AAFZ52_14580 [Bacteroidota bacterium]